MPRNVKEYHNYAANSVSAPLKLHHCGLKIVPCCIGFYFFLLCQWNYCTTFKMDLGGSLFREASLKCYQKSLYKREILLLYKSKFPLEINWNKCNSMQKRVKDRDFYNVIWVFFYVQKHLRLQELKTNVWNSLQYSFPRKLIFQHFISNVFNS